MVSSAALAVFHPKALKANAEAVAKAVSLRRLIIKNSSSSDRGELFASQHLQNSWPTI
jgi:hypothetical protein